MYLRSYAFGNSKYNALHEPLIAFIHQIFIINLMRNNNALLNKPD